MDPHAIPARREFKYLLPRAALPRLRDALGPWCARDPNAGPDGRYPLYSLYFDAPDLRLFHANEREAAVRFKARIRAYPSAPAAPVFAEIKMRDGDVIRKTRTRLPADGWSGALRRGALDPFTTRLHRHALRPVVLVAYDREAWMSRVDTYARVSIDSSVRCQEARALSLRADPRRWRTIDHPVLAGASGSPCVVELKWADAAPRWMAQLVQRLELIRASFSKYCYAMRALADDLVMDYREAQSPWRV